MFSHPLRERLLAAARRPDLRTDVVQVAKTVVASIVAWWLASEVIGLQDAFLAPWAALLTVHATVYRSFWRGAQSVLATVLGIVLAYLATVLVGGGLLALALALFTGLLLARVRGLRIEGVTVATTALFVLTAGGGADELALLHRFLDTAIGVSVGIAVNVVVVPPLHDRVAQAQIDRVNRHLGGLLETMAAELGGRRAEDQSAREWVERTRDIDVELTRAWQLVRHTHESHWGNPRGRNTPGSADPTGYAQVLRRLEEGVAQCRSMARTIDESTAAAEEWEPRFREPWARLLAETGRRVADPDADVGSLVQDVDDLTRDLSSDDLPGLLWPVYGSLISSLAVIVRVVDDVATARPVRT